MGKKIGIATKVEGLVYLGRDMSVSVLKNDDTIFHGDTIDTLAGSFEIIFDKERVKVPPSLKFAISLELVRLLKEDQGKALTLIGLVDFNHFDMLKKGASNSKYYYTTLTVALAAVAAAKGIEQVYKESGETETTTEGQDGSVAAFYMQVIAGLAVAINNILLNAIEEDLSSALDATDSGNEADDAGLAELLSDALTLIEEFSFYDLFNVYGLFPLNQNALVSAGFDSSLASLGRLDEFDAFDVPLFIQAFTNEFTPLAGPDTFALFNTLNAVVVTEANINLPVVIDLNPALINPVDELNVSFAIDNTGGSGIRVSGTGEEVAFAVDENNNLIGTTTQGTVLTIAPTSSGVLTVTQTAFFDQGTTGRIAPNEQTVQVRFDGSDGENDFTQTVPLSNLVAFEDTPLNLPDITANQTVENQQVLIDLPLNQVQGSIENPTNAGFNVVPNSLTAPGTLTQLTPNQLQFTPTGGQEGTPQFQVAFNDGGGGQSLFDVMVPLLDDSIPFITPPNIESISENNLLPGGAEGGGRNTGAKLSFTTLNDTLKSLSVTTPQGDFINVSTQVPQEVAGQNGRLFIAPTLQGDFDLRYELERAVINPAPADLFRFSVTDNEDSTTSQDFLFEVDDGVPFTSSFVATGVKGENVLINIPGNFGADGPADEPVVFDDIDDVTINDAGDNNPRTFNFLTTLNAPDVIEFRFRLVDGDGSTTPFETGRINLSAAATNPLTVTDNSISESAEPQGSASSMVQNATTGTITIAESFDLHTLDSLTYNDPEFGPSDFSNMNIGDTRSFINLVFNDLSITRTTDKTWTWRYDTQKVGRFNHVDQNNNNLETLEIENIEFKLNTSSNESFIDPLIVTSIDDKPIAGVLNAAGTQGVPLRFTFNGEITPGTDSTPVPLTDAITITPINAPGNFTIDGNSSFLYTPAGNETQATFTYTVTDTDKSPSLPSPISTLTFNPIGAVDSLIATDTTVGEEFMPGGTNPNPAELIKTGSITYTLNNSTLGTLVFRTIDGPDIILSDMVLFDTKTAIDGFFGQLDITRNELPGGGDIWEYSYTKSNNQAFNNVNGAPGLGENYLVELTDSNNQLLTDRLQVSITDDAPKAQDVATVAIQGQNATLNFNTLAMGGSDGIQTVNITPIAPTTNNQFSQNNGIVTFTPTVGQTEDVSFTYTLTDRDGSTSNESRGTIDIQALFPVTNAAGFSSPRFDLPNAANRTFTNADNTTVRNTTESLLFNGNEFLYNGFDSAILRAQATGVGTDIFRTTLHNNQNQVAVALGQAVPALRYQGGTSFDGLFFFEVQGPLTLDGQNNKNPANSINNLDFFIDDLRRNAMTGVIELIPAGGIVIREITPGDGKLGVFNDFISPNNGISIKTQTDDTGTPIQSHQFNLTFDPTPDLTFLTKIFNNGTEVVIPVNNIRVLDQQGNALVQGTDYTLTSSTEGIRISGLSQKSTLIVGNAENPTLAFNEIQFVNVSTLATGRITIDDISARTSQSLDILPITTSEETFNLQLIQPLIVGSNASDIAGSTAAYTIGDGQGAIMPPSGQFVLAGDTGGATQELANINILLMMDSSLFATTTLTEAGNMTIAESFQAAAINLIDDYVTRPNIDNMKVTVIYLGVPGEYRGREVTEIMTNGNLNATALSTVKNALNNPPAAINNVINYEAVLDNAIDWANERDTANAPYVRGADANRVETTAVSFLSTDPNYHRTGDNNGGGVSGPNVADAVSQVLGTGDGSNEIIGLRNAISAISSPRVVNGVNTAVTNMHLATPELSTFSAQTLANFQAFVNSTTEPEIKVAEDAAVLRPLINDFGGIRLDAASNDTVNITEDGTIAYLDVLNFDNLLQASPFELINGLGVDGLLALEQLNFFDATTGEVWTRESSLRFLQDPANRFALAQESTEDLNGVNTGRTGGDDTATLAAETESSFVFGQEGNDTLTDNGRKNYISTGTGEDTVHLNGESTYVHLGATPANVGEASSPGDGETDTLILDFDKIEGNISFIGFEVDKDILQIINAPGAGTTAEIWRAIIASVQDVTTPGSESATINFTNGASVQFIGNPPSDFTGGCPSVSLPDHFTSLQAQLNGADLTGLLGQVCS